MLGLPSSQSASDSPIAVLVSLIAQNNKVICNGTLTVRGATCALPSTASTAFEALAASLPVTDHLLASCGSTARPRPRQYTELTYVPRQQHSARSVRPISRDARPKLDRVSGTSRVERLIAARAAAVPTIGYPDLPVSAKRDELKATIAANQVV